ncbi:hypothetical protein [Maribacter arcticus]|uniref:3-keto-disaccharide hydrolase domain-containing protein n=1 Tax=Maribacter arcticus TaxID=561365 RepID=A0A1T5ECG9_9FLAO|nr:hypothetical protein [Maribacter arcticus]SKB81712.1 hypothetical protein SAMN05660866_03430 [Maribacter arcticus]
MKNIWIPFFTLILIVSSCSKDFEDVTSNQEVSSISLRGKMDKVSICHYDEDTDTWKTLNVSGNSLKGHLKHGDVIGECSTSVVYDFNDCSIDGFNTNGEGTFSIIDNGIDGCGVSLTRPISMRTDSQFSYGTYEMDTRASTGVSNQYMFLFLSEDFSSYGIGIGIQPDRTDDEGIDFIVNGVPLLQGRRSDIPVSYPNWYHVKVEVTPDYVKLWLDETLMYELYDYGGIENPIGRWEISSYSTSEFDNLKYTPM